jgi:hypothetical protein
VPTASTVFDGDRGARPWLATRGVAAAAIAVSLLGFCGAAFADSGGVPHGGVGLSCGVGRSEAHEFIAAGDAAGASEIATYELPVEFGCTGPPDER